MENNLAYYETMYLVSPTISENLTLQTIENYQSFLTEKGCCPIVQNRGRRHLKYPIKKCDDATYIQVNFYANESVLAGLDRKFALDEDVLRHMTFRVNN
jgi:small subunit ribosomal protein S6